MIKIGCCSNMIAKYPDNTGIEHIESLARLGFDYIELPLAELSELSFADFSALTKRVMASGVKCESLNNFFPKTMRLTGSHADFDRICEYAEFAFLRAAELGAKIVVFGSGPAKNIPDGFSHARAYEQVIKLLTYASCMAERFGITIVIEPLQKAECNLINTFTEGCKLADDVNKENVKVLVDYYHFSQENEPIENLTACGAKYLRHVHFARRKGRGYPKDMAEDNYKEFFDALRTVGFDGRISIEAYSENIDKDAVPAIELLRTHLNTSV